MSRSVSPAAAVALDATTIKQSARLTFYKSRTFFETLDVTDHAPAWIDTQEAAGVSIPEAFGFSETLHTKLTVLVEPVANGLTVHVGDSATPVSLGITAHASSRPGLWDNRIVYFDGSNWKRGTFDGNALTGISTISTVTDPGAAYPVSSTETILVTIDHGALRAHFVNASGATHTCPVRFFNPTVAMAEDSASDMALAVLGGAAKVEHSVFVYQSMLGGHVAGIQLQLNDSDLDGIWGDIFIAIPEDLSSFKVGNVFTANGKVFICGQFIRVDDFASTYKYTLLPWSTDGITFSMDRRILCSYIGKNFLAMLQGTTIHFSSCMRYTSQPASYQQVGEQATSSTYSLNEVQGNPDDSFQVSIKAGDELVMDDIKIDTGTFAKLEIGMEINNSGVAEMEWIPYHEVIVSNVRKSFRDGMRGAKVTLIPDALWHIRSITHPYYMEFAGREVMADLSTDFTNLYRVDDHGGGRRTSFMCDFYLMAGGQTGGGSHEGNSTIDIYSDDLNKHVSREYPVFGDEPYYDVAIYGWSRSGHLSNDVGYTDPTPVESVNDTVRLILLIQDESGQQSAMVTGLNQLQSTYDRWPQTWGHSASGSFPIIYRVPNPGKGKQLLKVGVRLIAPPALVADQGATTFMVERVEIPKLPIDPAAINGDGWTAPIAKTMTSWTLGTEISTGVFDPDSETGELISGLEPGKAYAVESFGDPWQFDAAQYGGLSRRFIISNSVGSAGMSSPPWYGGLYYDEGYGYRAMLKPYWAGQLDALDHYDDVPNARNYRVYFIAATDHVYVKLACEPHSSATVPTGNFSWRLSHAVPPAKLQPASKNTGSTTFKIPGVTLEGFSLPTSYAPGVMIGDPNIPSLNPEDERFMARIMDFAWGTYSYDEGSANVVSTVPMNPDMSSATRSHRVVLHVRGHAGNVFVPGGHRFSIQMFPCDALKELLHHTQHYYYYLRIEKIHVPAGGFTVSLPGDPDESYAPTLVWKGELEPTLGGFPDPDQLWTITVDYSSAPSINVDAVEYMIYLELRLDPYPDPFGAAANNYLYVPGFYIPGYTMELQNVIYNLTTRRKGSSELLFSTTPYSAWDFEVISRWKMLGPYSMVGSVGLATDGYNYMIGYVRNGYIGLAKVQGGNRSVLQEIAWPENYISDKDETIVFYIRLTHRGGRFYVETRKEDDPWPDRGSQIDYEWDADAEGPIAVVDDIFHLGVFTLIDPPGFRTSGFRDTSEVIPMLPNAEDVDGSSGWDAFSPSGGLADINGILYSYTGKVTAADPIQGPFDVKAFADYGGHNNPSDGYGPYPGPAIDVGWFQWLDDAAAHDDLNDLLFGNSEGFAFPIGDAEWRTWLQVEGNNVFPKDAVRLYAKDGEWATYSLEVGAKAWITNGLTGVQRQILIVDEGFTEGSIETDSGVTRMHDEGSYVYIDSNDTITLLGFIAASGDIDQDVRYLIDKICRVCGTQAAFPGDVKVASQVIPEGTEYTIQ